MAIMNEEKKLRGYKINFATETLVVNYTFNEALNDPTSAEYNLWKTLREDFPNMRIEVKSGRVQKKAHHNKRLTYKNMATYINAHANADELLDVFETVKALSKPLASPYAYVHDWFVLQFPNYKQTVIFKDDKITVAPVKPPQIIEYKRKVG